MKNLYLLPTDKPSRLYYNEIHKRYFINKKIKMPHLIEDGSQNIYITSDEEIKIGDWVFDIFKNACPVIRQLKTEEEVLGVQKTELKIILTTDQDLIGVQAIPDEFLEWFLKNPSCEEVEVKKSFKANPNYNEENQLYVKVGYWEYKIFIPKEESKNPTNQEVMFHQEHQEYFYEDIVDGKKIVVWLGKDYVPKEEPKQEQEQVLLQSSIDGEVIWGEEAKQHVELINDNIEEFDKAIELSKQELERGITITHVGKQETLEETVNKLSNKKLRELDSFLEGAKWQEQKTIEEVFEWLTTNNYLTDLKETLIKNFNQFKKQIRL